MWTHFLLSICFKILNLPRTVFQRFAGEHWEPVERWIQDWEMPQGFFTQDMVMGSEANHKLMNPFNVGLYTVWDSILVENADCFINAIEEINWF